MGVGGEVEGGLEKWEAILPPYPRGFAQSQSTWIHILAPRELVLFFLCNRFLICKMGCYLVSYYP